MAYIFGTAGSEEINGTAGDDRVWGLGGNDILIGGSGNDDIVGGDAADTIYDDDKFAQFGDDTIYAGGGNDTIYLFGGADLVDGGEGTDTVVLDFVSDPNGAAIIFDPETGMFRSSSGTVLTNVENITVYGSETASNYVEAGNGNDVLIGGSSSDFLVGGDGNDYISDRGFDPPGQSGADILFGGAGDDIILSSGGGDNIDGGEGTDELFLDLSTEATGIETDFDTANATLYVSNGTVAMNMERISIKGTGFDDILVTGSSSDDLLGGDGNDILVAGGGNDWLFGGTGHNKLTGGEGADSFVFSANELGFSSINDFSVNDDRIRLNFFDGLGDQNADFFGLGSWATNAEQRILYSAETGLLRYDADGNGSGAAVVIGQLDTGLALTKDSFDLL